MSSITHQSSSALPTSLHPSAFMSTIFVHRGSSQIPLSFSKRLPCTSRGHRPPQVYRTSWATYPSIRIYRQSLTILWATLIRTPNGIHGRVPSLHPIDFMSGCYIDTPRTSWAVAIYKPIGRHSPCRSPNTHMTSWAPITPYRLTTHSFRILRATTIFTVPGLHGRFPSSNPLNSMSTADLTMPIRPYWMGATEPFTPI